MLFKKSQKPFIHSGLALGARDDGGTAGIAEHV